MVNDATKIKRGTDQNAESVWLVAAGYGVPGGIEAHILHYATEMRRRGWSPVVVIFAKYPYPPHRFMEALDQQDIPRISLQDLAGTRIILRFLMLLFPWCVHQAFKCQVPRLRRFWSWVSVHGQVNMLRNQVSRQRPSVIHIFGRLSDLAWNVFPAHHTIFHQMMTGDIDGVWTPDEIEGFSRFAARCAGFMVPGMGVSRNLQHFFGIHCDMLPVYTLCPDALGVKSVNALVEARLARGRMQICFGVICRLTEQKGIVYLLDAILAYRERYGDVYFAFAGRGALYDMIHAFVDHHRLQHVTVEDVLDPVDFLSRIDVFVHPSVGDAMPMAIAEAMMCALPCIVSNVGGCPDLVRDNVDGFVIEPRRAGEILEGMVKFTEMGAARRSEFGRQARTRYESVCLPSSVGDVVEPVYKRVAKASIGRCKDC